MTLCHVDAYCDTFNQTAGSFQQWRPLRKDVTDVAMGHQVSAPISRLVYGVQFDLDATKTRTSIVAEKVIMITGNVDHPRTGSWQIKKPLQNLMMFRFPITRQRLPRIDDIADEINRLSFVCRQEIEDQVSTGQSRAKVHV